MSDASWSMLVVSCHSVDVEIVSDVLWSSGVIAIEERQVSEASNLVELWTSVGDDPGRFLDEMVDLERVQSVRVESVARDVADTWRQFAEPTIVATDVRIVPAWYDGEIFDGDVLIDPADTFGMGNHATTVGALRLLLRCSASSTLLDVGTGSGVLAVAMAKLRGSDATVFDISPSSREVVALNARLNNVSVDVVDGFKDLYEQFEVVVANILAPVLRELAQQLADAIVDDGVIVLAGMRTDQVQSVVDEFRALDVVDTETIDGWTAVALRNRASLN